MAVLRNEIINIACHCCFEELVVVRVIFDSGDILLWSHEFSKITDCFYFFLDFVFVHMEALGVVEESFTELVKRLYGNDDLILVVESLDE
jgi:hypothetical protein